MGHSKGKEVLICSPGMIQVFKKNSIRNLLGALPLVVILWNMEEYVLLLYIMFSYTFFHAGCCFLRKLSSSRLFL